MYGCVPDLTQSENSEVDSFEISDADCELLDQFFIDETNKLCGTVLDIGDYQYYNTEPKDKVFADLKKNIKISKQNIPAAM